MALAQWDNQKDLRVKGQDPYEAPGHSALMALVEEILTVTEAQIVNSRRFDATPVQPLTITHQIGSLSDEIFAIGSLSGGGMTVLKGSRLPLPITRVSDLTALDTHIAEIALGYHWRGVLDRQQGTLEETRVFTLHRTPCSGTEPQQLRSSAWQIGLLQTGGLFRGPCGEKKWSLIARKKTHVV